MKRHVSLAAFLATIAVVVPAAWHAVDADLERDGKHLRPLQKTLDLGNGVKVTLDVDRGVVMTGDTVTAKLQAFSDKRQQVTVDLHALHTTNYEGERVSTPWSQIDRETLTLTAAPDGGKPVTTQVKLGSLPAKKGLTDSFEVMITRHGQKFPKTEFFNGTGDEKRTDYESAMRPAEDGEPQVAAAVGIEGWSGNNLGIAIEREGKITDGTPFTVLVKVKNTTGERLGHHPWVNLSTQDSLDGTDDPTAEPPVTIERVDEGNDTDYETKWKRGETYTAKFTVTPHQSGLKNITFLAHASEGEGLGPAGPGAMDARTFAVAAAKDQQVAKK